LKPIKIAFINFKGGVGKTALAVNFAAKLSEKYRTLLIDLDPQSNASAWLMQETDFSERNKKEGKGESHKTVYQLFLDQMNGTRHFDFDDAAIPRVVQLTSGLHISPKLDLLPNTYWSMDLEGHLATQAASEDPRGYLQDGLKGFEERYQFVVIDCAPNLYILTQNAMVYSNYFIIPQFPDPFSHIGLAILCDRIDRSWSKYKKISEQNPKLNLLGTVFSRVRPNTYIENYKASISRTLDDAKSKAKNEDLYEDAELLDPPITETWRALSDSISEHIPTIYYKPSYSPAAQYASDIAEFSVNVKKKIGIE
jgi:chromosome partitioning protein